MTSVDMLSVSAVVFDIETVLNDEPDAACLCCDAPDAIYLSFDGGTISSELSVYTSHENVDSPVVDRETGSKVKSESSDLSPKSCGFFHIVPPGDNS